MFIEVENKLVNLDNVSSIIEHDDKVVFNLNYAVEVSTKKGLKDLPNYVYSKDLNIVENNLKKLNDFIHFGRIHINKDNISYVKFDDENLRVIVSFACSTKPKDRKFSDFIYIDAKDTDEYQSNIEVFNKLI